MIFSNLTTSTRISALSGQSRQGHKPERLIVHHMASTGWESTLAFMEQKNARLSCPTYAIGKGQIVGMIGEEYRPCSTGQADLNSITVEVLNTSGAPSWSIEESSFESLVTLLADLSARYGWGKIEVGKNLFGHSTFMATACPGPSLLPRLEELASRANERISKNTSNPSKKEQNPMAYSYTTINSQRVEVHVAAAFKKLAAAFKKQFGLELLVTSGTRTRAEQARLYDGWIKRLPGYNLAAPPGLSNHEESGPKGPRALDLRDSGRDAGVTRFGTVRGNWLAANAPKYGFTQAGATFNPREAWHYEHTGSLSGGTSGSGGSSSASPSKAVKIRQGYMNTYLRKNLTVDGLVGPATTAAYKAYQKVLGIKADGIWGSGTQKAHNSFKKAWDGKISEDGILGTATYRKLQARLAVNPDGIWGPASKKALQRALGVTADGIIGPATVKALQKKLKVKQDGAWGPATTKALQAHLNNTKTRF